MKRIVIWLLLLMLSSSLLLIAPVKSETATPAFWVEPGMVTVSPNDTFTVEVWLVNARDVISWSLAVAWNSSILTCVNAKLNIPRVWGGSFDLSEPGSNYTEEVFFEKAWVLGPGIVNNVNEYLKTDGHINFTSEVGYGIGVYSKCVIAPVVELESGGSEPGSDNHYAINVTMPLVVLTFQALQESTTSLQIVEFMAFSEPELNQSGWAVFTQLACKDNPYEPAPYAIFNGKVHVHELSDMDGNGIFDIFDAILIAGTVTLYI